MAEDPKGVSPEPGSSGRRQRAPTITIDTSAVSNISPPQSMDSDAVALKAMPNSPSTLQGDPASPLDTGSHPTRPQHSSQNSTASRISVPELRGSTSFESRESRPTSPHNVSSPTSRGGERGGDKTAGGFLAVPGLRSRQNSIDTDEGNHSNTDYSGQTLANSSQADKDREFGKKPGNDEIMNDPEALTPDPGHEADFVTDESNFAFSQGQLNKLINPKSLAAFYALGGLGGLEKGLRTDRKAGLSIDESDLDGTVSFQEAKSAGGRGAKNKYNDDSKTPIMRTDSKGSSAPARAPSTEDAFFDRKRIFKDNRLPVKKGKSLLQIMWITYNDKVLILLSIAAAVSLAVGLYQTFGTEHDPSHPKIEWVEGVAIIVAIVIVVVVGSLNDYQKERQFVKLNKKKQDRDVNVIRSGRTLEISVFDVLVGDVMLLEPGDMIPVDGIFIDGHNVKCDESQTTGESDLIRKHPADQVYSAIENHESLRKLDPFILSGAQVTEGVGTFLVTSTGVNSSYGKTLMSLREDPEVTPLQSKLNTLAEYIAKLGGGAGLLLFIVLFIEFLVRLKGNPKTPTEKGQDFLDIFIVTVTIIVVAVPEGLPLAVTLALAFATTRMLKDNNLVRHLKACEVMGNATTICSDKTGTLTQNKMLVVAGTLGTSSRFGGTVDIPNGSEDSASNKGKQVDSEPRENVPTQEVISSLDPAVKLMLTQSIVLNSTAFEGEVEGEKTFIGSKTETAMLIFARDFLGMGSVSQERSGVPVTQLIPFDSGRKCMGVVIQLENGKYRLYVKGASEILLEKCSEVIHDPTREPSSSPMTDDNRQTLLNLIDNYASRSLRTIAMVYRDFDKWPPMGARTAEGDRNEVVFEDVFRQMVLLGIVGIQDPLRDGVGEAVKKCQNAGVVVRMVTGDNMITAKAIATECGIFTAGGIVMEGPTFRKLSKTKMDQIIPRLQVLARSSPEDKRILVKRLKELGETVAVTGDGTNDAPALKTADVGFSMGIAGTEVAKEASAIILMDDNFASIVKAMMWGRAVNDAVKKFLQFQVTVNITAVLLTFITAVSSGSEESALTAVQLLWVNLIMDTMAALALATDPPTDSILDRKPDPKSAPLITMTMWKMIIGQSIYQLVITLLLHFGAGNWLNYDTKDELNQLSALVFNTFVWMQVFNQWNCRRLDNKFNIFEGLLNNYFFIGINCVMVGGQIMIIFVGGAAFNVTRLNGAQWGISLVLGFLSIPVGAVIRCIPDEMLIKLIPAYLKRKPKGPELTISDEEQQFNFPQPLADVKEELSFLKQFKGGRLNNLKFKMQDARDTWLPRSRSGSRSRSNSSLPQTPNNGEAQDDSFNTQPPAPTPDSRKRGRSNRSRSNSALGATTVMAGIIAGSIAGWSPIERGYGDNESMRFSRSQGRSELESRDDVEIHPDTKQDDPVITENPHSLGLPPSQVPEVSPAAASSSQDTSSPPKTTS
ncbi:hypothetical protein VTL71DRAFT_6007 [Oculimacula yallundae]|uniref:Calcium-transporting ATPase n=1 Tax=Oculimacula yallundae TaxID=86028 RepID=A0ABR4BZ53_9HELO